MKAIKKIKDSIVWRVLPFCIPIWILAGLLLSFPEYQQILGYVFIVALAVDALVIWVLGTREYKKSLNTQTSRDGQ
jgi:uncharacterized membrane protein